MQEGRAVSAVQGRGRRRVQQNMGKDYVFVSREVNEGLAYFLFL